MIPAQNDGDTDAGLVYNGVITTPPKKEKRQDKTASGCITYTL